MVVDGPDESRSVVVGFRVTPAERRSLDAMVARAGVSLTAFVAGRVFDPVPELAGLAEPDLPAYEARYVLDRFLAQRQTFLSKVGGLREGDAELECGRRLERLYQFQFVPLARAVQCHGDEAVTDSGTVRRCLLGFLSDLEAFFAGTGGPRDGAEWQETLLRLRVSQAVADGLIPEGLNLPLRHIVQHLGSYDRGVMSVEVLRAQLVADENVRGGWVGGIE